MTHSPRTNYGLRLSGKLGSEPSLEEHYVQKIAITAGKLREAISAAYASSQAASDEAWKRMRQVLAQLDSERAALLAAGYTLPDVTKLVLDHTSHKPARIAG